MRDRVLEACDDFLKLRNAFPEAHTVTLISNGGPSVVDARAGGAANALAGRPPPQPTGPSAHRNALNKYTPFCLTRTVSQSVTVIVSKVIRPRLSELLCPIIKH